MKATGAVAVVPQLQKLLSEAHDLSHVRRYVLYMCNHILYIVTDCVSSLAEGKLIDQ